MTLRFATTSSELETVQNYVHKMTALNAKSACLTQPIGVAKIRSQFQTAIGLGDSRPQLLLRFGYGEALPLAVRRPVAQVLD